MVQLASMFDYFPASEADQDRAIASITKYSDRILTGWDNEYWPIKDGDLMKFPVSPALIVMSSPVYLSSNPQLHSLLCV